MQEDRGWNVGSTALNHVFEQMQIDAAWSVRTEQRFDWWGHRLRQEVWADPPVLSDGVLVTRLRARTVVLEDVPQAEETLEKVSNMNRLATLNAFDFDPTTRAISLGCSFKIHGGSADWGSQLFLHAVVTQACEAERVADIAQELFGGRIAESAHPTSGARPSPDEMLTVIEKSYVPVGEGASHFGLADFEAAERAAEGISVLTNAGEEGLTAEFPYFGTKASVSHLVESVGEEAPSGPQTALFQAEADQRHPTYGGGCLLRLTLPLGGVTHAQAVQLNRAEALNDGEEYLVSLGAWCVGPLGLTHVCFLPNGVRMGGLVGTMLQYDAYRTRWARQVLAGA